VVPVAPQPVAAPAATAPSAAGLVASAAPAGEVDLEKRPAPAAPDSNFDEVLSGAGFAFDEAEAEFESEPVGPARHPRALTRRELRNQAKN
jgi:hypothetical protein